MRISKKLFLINSGIILVVLGLIFFSNWIYFKRYYINKKISQLEQISDYIKNPSSQFSLDEIEEKYRVMVDLVDMNSQEIFLPGSHIKEKFGEKFTKENIYRVLNKDGRIIQLKEDRRSGLDLLSYMSLYGKDLLLIVSFPVISIQEAVDYIVKFYLYILLIALVVSFAINYFLSKLFTNPLRELTSISRHMANLSFHKKAEIKTGDEVEELANSMNHMSEKLEETIKKLENSNEKLKDEIEKERMLEKFRKNFISSVSHELKTPIALISGYAEGLKDGIADDESREFYCQVIMDEASRMDRIAKDLLFLSQMEAGYFKFEKSKLDLKELIEETVKKFEILINEKKLTIIKKMDYHIQGFGNREGLEVVLNNLVSNAVKYSLENGEVKIGMEDCKERIKIWIYNSSKKISKEELDKIWTPFYKLDKSGSKKYGGTGLGLAIVKEALEKHGSEYGVKALEDGIEFYFYLEKTPENTKH